MTSRVLVTGASGFIGRPLVTALSRAGVEVVGASRRRPATATEAVDWIEVDLLTAAPDRLVEAARAECLVHLAWIATPGVFPHSLANLAWLTASADLAKAFIASGGQRIVGVGSCFEYDIDAAGPRTLYGASKHACRLAFEQLVGGNPHCSLAWARVFYLLGAEDHQDRLAPSLARRFTSGVTAEISRGLIERDFIDVRDCAQAIAELAICRASGAFDIATGRAVRLRELAETIASRAGRPELLQINPALDRQGEPARLVGDPAALVAATGFMPTRTIEQSVDDILAYWHDRR